MPIVYECEREGHTEALTSSTVGPARSQFSWLRRQATGQWLGLPDKAVGSIEPQEPCESTMTKLWRSWPRLAQVLIVT